MYDPAVGRFLSEDPLGFDAGDTNLQRYVGNSSPNFTDPSGMTPASDFWGPKYTDKQRQEWFDDFHRRFGSMITRAATLHGVPAELLATVVANEYVDIHPIEGFLERNSRFGKSLGPCQIHVRLADKYELFPDLRYVRSHPLIGSAKEVRRIAIRVRLNDPEANIFAAARLMRIFLDRFNELGRTKKFSHAFVTDLLLLGPQGIESPAAQGFLNELRRIANSRGEARLKFDVSQTLIQAMAGAFNDDITIATESTINENVKQHVINALAMDGRFNRITQTPNPIKRRSPQIIRYQDGSFSGEDGIIRQGPGYKQ